MSDNINRSAVFAAIIALAAVEGFAASVESARAVKAEDRTKDQKLALKANDIVKAVESFDNLANDRVVAKAGKTVYAPAVGDKVIAVIGRNTATSQAKSVEGTVVAIKTPAEGEKGATQVRVRVFEGTFDEQLVTLYPAQLTKVEEVAETQAQG